MPVNGLPAQATVLAVPRSLTRTLFRPAFVVAFEDIDRLAHELKEMKALPTPLKRKIGFDL
jgi:hypothetical protein